MATISVVATKGKERLWVKLAEATPAMANSIRRAILGQLPTFGIDEVHFYENTSPVYNEYLAHRIGLVPLTWEEGVADDARIMFSLQVDGPRMVLSGDLKSNDETIKVHNDQIPLVKLGEGQKLRLDAFAVKGIGRNHAKFQGAHASYTQWVDVKAKGKAAEEVKVILPRAKFDGDALSNPHEVDALSVADMLESKGADVKVREDAFLFQVESYNNVSAATHLKRAIKLLRDKCQELEDVKI